MADLTDRLSSQTNASADINTLLKGTPFWRSDRTYDNYETINYQGTIYASQQGSNLNKNPSSEAAWWTAIGGGGGSSADFEVSFPAGSFDYPTTNPAPFEYATGTNGKIGRHLFDDTTEEQVESVFTLPSAIAGTVTFELYGYSITAAASKNVEFTLYHSARQNAEDWDDAYSSKISGDLATNSSQDSLSRFTWTETISNLGWTANDQVRIKLGRTAPSVNNLVGDYGITHFKIIVPRA